MIESHVPLHQVSDPIISFSTFFLKLAIGFELCTHNTFLGALKKWRLERGWDPNNPTRRLMSVEACEHIVVFNKRDLVLEWGIEVQFWNLLLNIRLTLLVCLPAFQKRYAEDISSTENNVRLMAKTKGYPCS